jgi:hypothetical protein
LETSRTALQFHTRVKLVINMPTDKWFKQYRRTQIAEMRPYEPGESVDGISISGADRDAGSPKLGDMIARNPRNHADRWLVAAQYFMDNFEPVS